MTNLNKVFIMGRLGQDPELRYTQNQSAVVNMSIATTERYDDKSGQKQERTEWHRIVAWGKQAENAAKYLKKGSAVHIEGKLQTRQWDDKDGKKCYTTEVVASNVTFLPSGQGQQQNQGHDQPQQQQGNGFNAQPSYPNTPDNSDVPF